MAESNEVVVSVDIESSPDDVWRALTTDAGLGEWMGDGAHIGSDTGDALFVPDVVTGTPRFGTISTFDENECLEYSWWPQGGQDERTSVSITLEPCEVGTRVTVVESLPQARSTTSTTASASAACVGAAWSWRTSLLMLASTSMLAAVL